MDKKRAIYFCLVTLAVQQFGIDAQGSRSSFRRSNKFRPPPLASENAPTDVAPPFNAFQPPLTPAANPAADVVPPDETFQPPIILADIPLSGPLQIDAAGASIPDFGNILTDPVIQGLDSGQQQQQTERTIVQVPRATNVDFKAPEQGPQPVTDGTGITPPEQRAAHVHLPGELHNDSPFPVLHVDGHSHTESELASRGGITHQKSGPSDVRPINMPGDGVHIDHEREHGNPGPGPMGHRTERPINVPGDGVHIIHEGEHGNPGPGPMIHRTGRPINVPGDGVHIDQVGEHGNPGPGLMVHRTRRPINVPGYGVHIDHVGEHDNPGPGPMVHRTGRPINVPGDGVHIDQVGEHNNPGPGPMVHRTGRPINVPGEGVDNGSPGPAPVLIRPGRPINVPPNIGRPINVPGDGVHIDHVGEHDNPGPGPMVHRTRRPINVPGDGVHIDRVGEHNNPGPGPMVHRTGRPINVPGEGAHVDLGVDNRNPGPAPILIRPGRPINEPPNIVPAIESERQPIDLGGITHQPSIASVALPSNHNLISDRVRFGLAGEHSNHGSVSAVHRPRPNLFRSSHDIFLPGTDIHSDALLLDLPMNNGNILGLSNTRSAEIGAVQHSPIRPLPTDRTGVDLSRDRNNIGTESLVHRPDLRAPHNDIQPAFHDLTAGISHQSPLDTRPVVDRLERNLFDGIHMPQGRLPGQSRESVPAGNLPIIPEHSLSRGIHIDLSSTGNLHNQPALHPPEPATPQTLHIDLSGEQGLADKKPVHRPIMHLPIDGSEIIPVSSNKGHLDATSQHDKMASGPVISKHKAKIPSDKFLPLVSIVKKLANTYKKPSFIHDKGMRTELSSVHGKVAGTSFVDKVKPRPHFAFPKQPEDIYRKPVKPLQRARGFIDVQLDFIDPHISHKLSPIDQHKPLGKLPGVIALAPGNHIDLDGEHGNKLGKPAVHTKDGRHIPIDPAANDPVGFPDNKLIAKDPISDKFPEKLWKPKPILEPFKHPTVIYPKRTSMNKLRSKNKKFRRHWRGKGGRRRKGFGKKKGWKSAKIPKIDNGKIVKPPKKPGIDIAKSPKKPAIDVVKPVKKPPHKDTITIIRIPPRGPQHPLEALRNIARNGIGAMLGGLFRRMMG